MVYKVEKRLVSLTLVLFLASLFFTLSVYLSDYASGGLVVCFVVVVFILFNLLVLFSKKIELSDGSICQKTLYGSKCVDISEIEDIGIVKLRWRIILILSDPHKFVFISSLYEDFEGFVASLKEELSESVEGLIDPVTPKLINKKRKFLSVVILAMIAFFVGSGVYNILYR